jgi:hypothetical protein
LRRPLHDYSYLTFEKFYEGGGGLRPPVFFGFRLGLGWVLPNGKISHLEHEVKEKR